MSKKKKFSYYSFDRILSYNAVINMVMGARGLGKTYGAKRMVIKNSLEKGEQFIYLRRYKPELKGCKTFFADIAHEFPDYEFRVHGTEAQYRGFSILVQPLAESQPCVGRRYEFDGRSGLHWRRHTHSIAKEYALCRAANTCKEHTSFYWWSKAKGRNARCCEDIKGSRL